MSPTQLRCCPQLLVCPRVYRQFQVGANQQKRSASVRPTRCPLASSGCRGLASVAGKLAFNFSCFKRPHMDHGCWAAGSSSTTNLLAARRHPMSPVVRWQQAPLACGLRGSRPRCSVRVCFPSPCSLPRAHVHLRAPPSSRASEGGPQMKSCPHSCVHTL